MGQLIPDTTGGRCGQYRGYQVHKREGTEPCDACRRANAEYSAAHRARTPERLNRESRYSSVRSRALARLAAMHPAEMAALMAEEWGR